MSYKVLIVEDDPVWLEIFQIIVGDVTHEVFEYSHAADLKSAVEALKTDKFNLILLDLILPDSDAGNTIEVVTSQFEQIPIVIISTLDDKKMISFALQRGIEDYIIKDQYDLITFLNVSRQAIRRFLSKWENTSIHKRFEKILKNLLSIDMKLEEMENSFQKTPAVMIKV